jgi:DNA-binding NarL/FixJ family response regulator
MAHDPLWSAGAPEAAITEELTLSRKTVSNQVSNIFAKSQVVDRAQAVLRAQQAGIDYDSMTCHTSPNILRKWRA